METLTAYNFNITTFNKLVCEPATPENNWKLLVEGPLAKEFPGNSLKKEKVLTIF